MSTNPQWQLRVENDCLFVDDVFVGEGDSPTQCPSRDHALHSPHCALPMRTVFSA